MTLGIPRWLRTLALVLTFLAGPVGLLVHLSARLAHDQRLAVEEA